MPNNTFLLMGGVHAVGLRDVSIRIDGTLRFSDDIKNWCVGPALLIHAPPALAHSAQPPPRHAVHARVARPGRVLVLGADSARPLRLRQRHAISSLGACHVARRPLVPGTKMPVTSIVIEDSVGLTLTSSGVGTLDGNGAKWWGVPGVGYLTRGKNRPAPAPYLEYLARP